MASVPILNASNFTHTIQNIKFCAMQYRLVESSIDMGLGTKQLPVVTTLLLSMTCLGLAQEKRMNDDPRCPVWMKPKVGVNGTVTCVCRLSFDKIVLCDQSLHTSRLLMGYCMTEGEGENDSEVVGRCPFSYHKPDFHQLYITLPQNTSELNTFMCGGLNRTGLLCSQCEPGLGPAVFSFTHQCLECLDSKYGWLLYIFVTTFPTTVLFFVIVFFQVRILTFAPMNAFIFICQVCANQLNIHPHIILLSPSHNLTLIFLTLFGIWNLDFFTPPFCPSSKLTGLQVASLEYAVAFYPLVIIIIIYYCVELHDKGYRVFVCLARPFYICTSCLGDSWNPKASLIHAFAAFLLLAYSKILVVSYSLLTSNTLTSSDNVSSPVGVYYDSSVQYFSTQHLPFAILAITVLLFCVALPMLVLLLYPTKTFQKCLGCCSIRWHALHAFADVFQSCYKNGTAGTPDYRCFAGLYLLLRIILNTSQMLGGYRLWLIKIIVPGIAALLFSLMRPYKDNRFNILDSLAFALLSFTEFWALYDVFVSRVSYAGIYIMPSMALIYISLYSAYRVLSWAGVLRRCSCKWVGKLLSPAKENVSAQRSHENDSDDNEVPDRVNNPELYEPLLPATSGMLSGGEDIDTYPQC